MIILIWFVVLVAVLKLYFDKVYSKFRDHGVKNLDVVPIFGNLFKVIFRQEQFGDNIRRIYDTFPEERFVGKYEFMKPILLIRDLELVKKITIKDFEHFLDHRRIANEDIEPLFARNLISLKGQEWKDMRSTLSPAFTSSKIKLMVPFMEEVGEQMIKTLKTKIEKSSNGYINIDCKDLTTRYANDVIASCAFGLKVDSHTDENNTFYKMGKKTTTVTFQRIIMFFASSSLPWLTKKLDFKMIANDCQDFFVNLVLGTMRERDTRGIVRPDMIHLLMEAKKGKLNNEDKGADHSKKDTGFATAEDTSISQTNLKRDWSDIDLVAQAVLFFIAGFDTISTAMSFALHELAINPEIQDRLFKEIKEHDAKNGGKLNFDSIQNMHYMDMVTSEVLRLWPPAMALDRLCVKDYNLGKPNSKATEDYIMKKGEVLTMPVWCFHRDPDFFPEPTKFDPERFSDENKHKINLMAYMPFGQGPRNCIGSRFALCELKTLLYQILLHLEVSPSENTKIPSRLSVKSFNPRLDGGHVLRFKVRS